MLGVAHGMGNPIHSLDLPLNCGYVPLTLSTHGTIINELGPKRRLTYMEEREEKTKLVTESPDGAGRCWLLPVCCHPT